MEIVWQSLKSLGIRAALVAVWLGAASVSQSAPPACIDACALGRAKAAGLVASYEANKVFFTSRRFSEADTRALLLRKDKKMNTTEARRHRGTEAQRITKKKL